MIQSPYRVGGSLQNDDPTYVLRRADQQIHQALQSGEFCYVFNARQMGKSSLLVRVKHQLEQEGFRCTTVDMTRIGSQHITPLQWYKGLVGDLWRGFGCIGKINFKKWWEEQSEISLLQRLSEFIEELLIHQFPDAKLCILIDEIDSILSLDFSVDDFFALIRYCYNQRSLNPAYQRLSFALFGVATPSDLIQDKTRTPFNIGVAIDLTGFSLADATPLLVGFRGISERAPVLLQEILNWTGGQPFLTQKLCQLVLTAQAEAETSENLPPSGTEAYWIESLVRSQIIQHWESQDEPEHLKTIRDRLLYQIEQTGQLLGLYQQILQNHPVASDDSREQIELLLSGLVVKHQGYLAVKNPIYREVFNLDWVEKQLAQLRPYSQTFQAWITSQQTDQSRLLRGQALKDAQTWAQGKSLSPLDYQFLAESEKCDRAEEQQALEAARLKAVEALLIQEKQAAQRQKKLLGVVTIALILACGLGIMAYLQSRQSAKSEILALVAASEARFASHRRLDSLVAAIKAKHHLRKLAINDSALTTAVDQALQQSVHGFDEINRLSGHDAALLAIAIRPDSSLIATGSVDNTIRLWQRNGQEIAILKGHQSAVRTLRFSPDGQWFASSSDDGTIKLWTAQGELLRTLTGHQAAVWGLGIHPQGNLIVSASFDRTIKFWKPDGTLIKTVANTSGGMVELSFSPDGQEFAIACLDNIVQRWTTDGTLIQTIVAHPSVVGDVVYSPDGKYFATGGGDFTVKLWTREGKLLKTMTGHQAVLTGLAFSPDGKTLASASRDKTIQLWNLDGSITATFQGHQAGIWDLAWSRDGRFLVSAGADNVARIWQPQNPWQRILAFHQGVIWALDGTADDSAIATASEDRTVRLWDRFADRVLTLQGHQAAVYGVSFSRDGQYLASSSADNTVKVWRRNGQLLTTFRKHQASVFTVAFSHDGELLASGSQDNTLYLWKRDGTVLAQLKQSAPVWHILFHPDDQTFASTGGDGKIRLWSRQGKLLQTLSGHTAAIWRLAYSRDGNTFASASGDNTIKLWNRQGKLLKTFPKQGSAVWGVGFSADGQMVASGNVDAVIRLWQRQGQPLMNLRGHGGAVRSLAISRDGQFLASAGEDNNLILWNLPRILQGNLFQEGCQIVKDYLQTNPEIPEVERDLCRSSVIF